VEWYNGTFVKNAEATILYPIAPLTASSYACNVIGNYTNQRSQTNSQSILRASEISAF
jgi:hypothetical protein